MTRLRRSRPVHEVGAPDETLEAPAATVTVYPDGPLVVRGDFAVQGVDGSDIDTGGAAVALCRCGRSAVKPLCDGSHKIRRARSAAGSSSSS